MRTERKDINRLLHIKLLCNNIYGFALGSGNLEGAKREHKAVLMKHITQLRRELLTCYTRCHGCHDRQGMECHGRFILPTNKTRFLECLHFQVEKIKEGKPLLFFSDLSNLALFPLKPKSKLLAIYIDCFLATISYVYIWRMLQNCFNRAEN